MKLHLLLFVSALVAGCSSHSQDRTGSPGDSAPTGHVGGTMTNAPNGKGSGGATKDHPLAKDLPPTPRAVDDFPEGKDVALSWSSELTSNGLAIHYTIKSLSDADIWVLDRLSTGNGGSFELDSAGAYRFERGGNLRLLMGAAPGGAGSVYRRVPYARLLRAHGRLEGQLSMGVPVTEYNVYYGPPRDPSADEIKHVERVTVMLQYVLAGPDLSAEESRLIPGALTLLGAISEAKVAISERPLALDVFRRTGEFSRVNLPGEPDESYPPGVKAWVPEPLPPQSDPKPPVFGDVEKYAELMASIRAGYPARSAVLAEAGLTGGSLVALRDHWCGRFATGPGAAELRARFVRIFTPALAARESARSAAIAAEEAAAKAARAGSAKAVSTPPPVATDPGGAAESPSAPVVSGHDAAQVHLLPTFLQAPVPGDNGLAAKAPISPSLPTPPGPPLMGETLELDPVAILAGISAKMPFDSRRPSAASVPSATPSKGREQSGQTLDLDPTALGALAAAAIAKGPPRGTAGAPPAATATPSPPATPPRKRLVRFDPQTGTPLATPYWEDLPSTGDTSARKR